MSGIQLLGWVAIAIVSCGLTAFARRYALRRGIMDLPCQRSSHSIPTPRGGGLAIMAVALAVIAIGGLVGAVDSRVAIGLVGGGLAVGWVGWMDDRRELPARVRLLVHLAGSLWFLLWIGGLPSIAIGPYNIQLGIAGTALAALVAVWFVNLYNFMDGIDGLAAGQAVAAGTIGGVMLLLVGNPSLAVVAFCVAAASAGFLVWNWAPAQIFMGDAGSGFLGFVFVALAFASERANAVPFAAWLVLLGVFFFDTTATLLRRMVRGEKWREGHRLHAFQRVGLKIGSHAITSAGILLLTVTLGVMAWWLTVYPQYFITILGAAAIMLTAVYAWVETVTPMFGPQQATASTHTLGGAERLLGGAEIFEHAGGDLVMARPHPYEHHHEEPIATQSMSA